MIGESELLPPPQLEAQRRRWDSRASQWDESIRDPDHYANFEDGYERFLEFERERLASLPDARAGLDIGCGTGGASMVLSEKVEKLFLVDFSEKMLEEARKKIPAAILLWASATSLPVQDASVDIAVSRGVVISHLPQGLANGFLDELARVMKPGGTVIFDFLCNLDTAEYRDISPKGVFERQQVWERLESRGFADILFDGEPRARVVRVSATKE